MVKWKKLEDVALVEMCNGTNRQNFEFARQMNQCFDEILSDNTINALVLTSDDEKNFSQGIDVEWMIEQLIHEKNKEIVISFLEQMNNIFKRLMLMPIPSIAAINGHAFGNGAILSCACDFRFMRKDKGFFCFPEVDVHIPFFPGMIAFIRKAMPEALFNEMALTGKRITATELELHKVIIKACDNMETLMTETFRFANSFQKSKEVFGEIKKRMHKSIVKIIEQDDPVFIKEIGTILSNSDKNSQ